MPDRDIDTFNVDIAEAQRRTVLVLVTGQVLGGVAFGATLSLGALLAARLSGDDSLSGLATASITLGAALCAIPLARLATRYGRRLALSLGNLLALVGIVVVVTAASLGSFLLLLAGVVLVGMGNAGNLQARFAATDLAEPRHRGRALGTVLWATTVGGVLGPLMLTPGEAVGRALGMPPLTGAYSFAFVAQVAALALYLVALRPDPLLLAQQRDRRVTPTVVSDVVEPDRPGLARYAIFAVAGSHVVMASVMAMTPIHLAHLDPDHVTTIVGVTIALHVFGMYGLSPVFGILADRWGRLQTILFGQVILAASLVIAALWPHSSAAVLVALILLGLGWSASTVSGAALLTEASQPEQRTRRQGISDMSMTLSAAVGAVLAGIVLDRIGYAGLALSASVIVVAIVVLLPFAARLAALPAGAGR